MRISEANDFARVHVGSEGRWDRGKWRSAGTGAKKMLSQERGSTARFKLVNVAGNGWQELPRRDVKRADHEGFKPYSAFFYATHPTRAHARGPISAALRKNDCIRDRRRDVIGPRQLPESFANFPETCVKSNAFSAVTRPFRFRGQILLLPIRLHTDVIHFVEPASSRHTASTATAITASSRPNAPARTRRWG
jgi:hypothetical protein